MERGGELVYRPPFVAKGVEFYGFALRADSARLQDAICDRYLNRPTNGGTDFRPAGPYVVLAFCNLPILACTDPPYCNMGWFAEQETAVWILLVDHKRERLVWFHPYIFVDSAYAMAMGRELYGFPKSIGWFQIPESVDNADLFAAETLVLKTFSPDTKGTRARLLEVRQTRKADPASTPWTTMAEFMMAIVGLLEREDSVVRDVRLAFDTAEDLVHGRLPMVFLKQFRDVSRSALASYQSIVEVPSKLLKFHQGRLIHHEYAVTVNPCQSHPVRADLGLAADTVVPVLSFWANFDFEIGEGIEVWRA